MEISLPTFIITLFTSCSFTFIAILLYEIRQQKKALEEANDLIVEANDVIDSQNQEIEELSSELESQHNSDGMPFDALRGGASVIRLIDLNSLKVADPLIYKYTLLHHKLKQSEANEDFEACAKIKRELKDVEEEMQKRNE